VCLTLNTIVIVSIFLIWKKQKYYFFLKVLAYGIVYWKMGTFFVGKITFFFGQGLFLSFN